MEFKRSKPVVDVQKAMDELDLSQAQTEVLLMSAVGADRKAIAGSMHISVKTVESHLKAGRNKIEETTDLPRPGCAVDDFTAMVKTGVIVIPKKSK